MCYINRYTYCKKKAIRILTSSHYLAHTKPLFIAEDILPFKLLIEFNSIMFMYDYLNLRLPETFDNNFSMVWQRQNDINYNLRNLHDFDTTLTRYVFLDSHPLYNYPRIWNDIPSNLKSIGSRNIFAKKVKEYLFTKDFDLL